MKYLKLMALVWSVLIFQTAEARTMVTMQADKSFSQGTYHKAIGLYKKAFVKEKAAAEKSRIVYRIGECYRLTADPVSAEAWYQKAIKSKYGDPIVYWHLGAMQKEQAKYAEAIVAFKRYEKETGVSKPVSEAISSCQMAQQWVDAPEKFDIVPEYLLNSNRFDFSPTFGAGRSNNTLYFASGRESSTGDATDGITGEDFQDLYYATRDQKGKWSEPQLLGPEINTEANEGSACLNKKRNQLFFTRCPLQKNANLGCDIYMSAKVGRGWGEAKRLDFKPEGADSISVGHPALSADDQVLVFVSDLPGGQGGKDLWYSIHDKKADTWSDPVNLGPHINTPNDEMFPFLHTDGSLYFASNGHPGMGGLDMFKAQADGFADWKQPENLKYPLNSSAHDYGIVFDGEEERGYFTSNREGGKGQDDIYNFRKQDILCSLTCIIRDLDSGEPIANADIHLVGSDKTSYKVKTDAQGQFEFEFKNETERYIQLQQTYTIKAEMKDYFVGKDMISTVDLKESTHFIKEMLLQFTVPENGTTFEMPEVLYAYNEYKLLNEPGVVNSFDSLDYLYTIMIENPGFVVELYSHTDTRGSNASNRRLSQKRAQSCVAYLVEKGISPERLKPVGRGEDEPRISDEAISKMKTQAEFDAAHQKNRRTEFSVIRTDFIPKNED